MAYSLMTKFNELTSGAFGYLVLESVDVDIGADSVRVNLIYPELKEKEVRKQYDQITEAVVKAMGSKAMVSVKLTKSHFDCDFFKAKLITFFENYPSVAPYVFADDIEITRNADYDFSVKLKLDKDVLDYAVSRGVTEDVKKMLASSYCENVSFEFVPEEKKDKTDYIELAEEELKNYVYRTSGGHFIGDHFVNNLFCFFRMFFQIICKRFAYSLSLIHIWLAVNIYCPLAGIALLPSHVASLT